MYRVLLTLFLAFALAAGGFISAGAAAACPTQAQAAAHDCCPEDQQPAGDDGGSSNGMMDCALMQLCRAAPAVAPGDEGVAAPTPAVLTLHAPRSEAAPPHASLDGVFRPPRAL